LSDPLVARGLTKSYEDLEAVRGVDLAVAAGEVHALVGLNGAGKTTLMRLLLGMARPDAGTAMILGTEVSQAGPALWAEVGHLIEAPSFYPELKVSENLRASALLSGCRGSSVGMAVERAVDTFGLSPWRNRRASSLSLGNRQRLGLAAATLHEPSVLVLDEPANSLDPAGVVFTRDLLQRLASKGVAVLLSSHHFDQLARIADRISVMHRGELVGSLDPAGVDLEQQFFELVRESDVTSGLFA